MNKLQIEKELKYQYSRSSGSGGQHVNKVSTRVELLFDIASSLGLSEKEQSLLFELLDSRINKAGVLVLSEQNSRSQHLNKRRVTKRFFTLIEEALAPKKIAKGAPQLKANPHKKRIEKTRHSEKKTLRKKIELFD